MVGRMRVLRSRRSLKVLLVAGLVTVAPRALGDQADTCPGAEPEKSETSPAAPGQPTLVEDMPGPEAEPGAARSVKRDSEPAPPAEGAPPGSTGKKQSGWIRWNSYDSGCFTARLHTRQMFDYTIFGQNATSVTQLGKINSEFEWREARFMVSGLIPCFENPWSYYVSFDFGGFDLPQGQRFGLAEAWVEFPVNEWVGTVTVGKVKERFSLEFLTTGGYLAFMERALQAFYVAREAGVIVANRALESRVTWALGAYGNWTGGGTSSAATVRVTGLPLYENEGRALIHLGAGGRWMSVEGSTQVQARPATHVGPYFANTGSFGASDAWGADAEFLGILGPWSLRAEVLETWFTSSSAGNPNLWGYYVSASWLVTGETLPYSRERAIPTAIVPRGRWGAAEISVRWFVNDLDSGQLAGGRLGDLQAGASWYIGSMFRVDFNYGQVWLQRFGLKGLSSVYGFRLQFQI